MARILIVDDDAAIRRSLSRLLVHLGYDVVAVGDFTRYRELIDPRKFDLVFLDVRMPRMNGGDVYAALHLAHTQEGFEIVPSPPVVMITGHPDDEALAFVRESGIGFRDLLEKPFSSDQIKEMAARYIPRPQLRPQLMEKSTQEKRMPPS